MKLHTLTCEIIRNKKKYKVKVTQQLGQFDIGHYCGYIEHKDFIVGVFQSTNSPKDKITLQTLDEEFNHIFRSNT